MAGSLEDVESWLPTEFLTEEELLMEKENFINNGLSSEFNPAGFSFPTEFPYEFELKGSSASLSSPDESVVGSSEIENCDEDDFLAGLTRRLTQQFTVKPDNWVVAGSPESTLSGIGSWSVSSNGSPNGVLSPPTTPFRAKNDTWDLIYAAAGQVARLKMSNEGNKYNDRQGRGLLGTVRSQHADTILKNQNPGLYSSQSFNHSVSQMNQYHSQVRQEPLLKSQCPSVCERQQMKAGWQAQPQPQQHHHPRPQIQSHFQHQQQQIQIQSRGRSVVGYENGRCVRPLGIPQSAWPPLQVQSNKQQHLHQHQHQHQQPQQHSSTGMRAVFLGGSGVKRECAGTGVFLPRRYGNPPDSKKKSACSTVLLPAKVVQALNLNFEDMNMNNQAQVQPRINCTFASDYDALMARRNVLLAQQKRNLRAEGVLNHEVRLPQEWTY
ncbi:hypothetical protein P3X46_014316 [Hevea brasiliensis]|uniref:Uncharacterized protein n=1 Tax=Hevea brasiliensis TaxID=3981 RepID=A0ABQ9M695_HEVBR|nr:uncharacterized protein LOC110633693 isoform X2 [Hevea brasiliensis]KAJ9175802.1 hypothetical protein P3X46_014316 [Hevea brasiliensis]